MKRHLSVGINKYLDAPLSGCVNDAQDWHDLLTDRESEGRLLTNGQATRHAILGGLADLITSTHMGDTAVFTYSGHGTWIPDVNGDEADGRDEAIVPFDYLSADLITDDTLYNLVQKFRARGARILFIIDACNSGTVERFFGRNDAPRRARTARYMPPRTFMTERMLGVAKKVESTPANLVSRTGAALLSGCRDDEVSWDIDFDGRANGAMTRAAIDAMRSNSPANLTAWQTQILRTIEGDQTPQVQGTYFQRRRTRFI